jgi:hypothetical protein
LAAGSIGPASRARRGAKGERQGTQRGKKHENTYKFPSSLHDPSLRQLRPIRYNLDDFHIVEHTQQSDQQQRATWHR